MASRKPRPIGTPFVLYPFKRSRAFERAHALFREIGAATLKDLRWGLVCVQTVTGAERYAEMDKIWIDAAILMSSIQLIATNTFDSPLRVSETLFDTPERKGRKKSARVAPELSHQASARCSPKIARALARLELLGELGRAGIAARVDMPPSMRALVESWTYRLRDQADSVAGRLSKLGVEVAYV